MKQKLVTENNKEAIMQVQLPKMDKFLPVKVDVRIEAFAKYLLSLRKELDVNSRKDCAIFKASVNNTDNAA